MFDRRQGLKAVAALAGLALSGGRARAQGASAVVPLSEQRSRFLVEVGVDGSAGYRFVLDTGASTHFISMRLVEALQLPRVDDRLVRGYDGSNREMVVGIDRLSIGGVEMGKSRAIAWAPERLDDHDGLIGYPFLFPRAVVDLGAGRISLGEADPALGLAPVRARVMRNQALLLGGVGAVDGRFVFDTGAQACTVSAAYQARIANTVAYKAAAKLVNRTADGRTRVVAFRPAEMRFGDFALPEPIVRIAPAEGGEGVFHEVDGLFGVSLLKPYTWAIDQAAGTVRAGGRPQRLGWVGSGFSIERRDGLARVSSVVLDSPAEEAGIKPGQTVLWLGGDADRPVLELLDGAARRRIELQARTLL